MFFFLPETEGRTLEEIELFFSDNKRKMIDRHIRKADDQQTGLEPIHIKSIANGAEILSGGCENKAFDEGNTKSVHL